MSRLRATANDTFHSLRYRNFRLFFGGQIISQVGNWLTLVAQSLLVLKLTDSGLAVGLLGAAQFGPVLLLSPIAGLVADRSDKRRLLLIVQSLAMVQSFVLSGLAFMPDPPLVALYLAAAVGGVTLAFDNPARRAFVVEMVPLDDVNNAVSLNSAMMTSSRVVGPALAGLLITTVGYGWCFAFDGLSYAAVLVALARIRTSELRPAPVAARGRGQVRAGLRYVRSMPDLWIPLVMMVVIGTLTFNFSTVLPLFVHRSLGGGDAMFTLLFSTVSVGSLIGALVAANRRVISVRDVVRAAAAFGVTMCLLAVAPTPTFAFAVAPLVGVASIGFLTSSTTLVQVQADPTMRGRVLALQAMVFLGSTPIGGPVLGAITDHFGARRGIGVGGVAALVAAAWGWRAARVAHTRTATLPDSVVPVADPTMGTTP